MGAGKVSRNSLWWCPAETATSWSLYICHNFIIYSFYSFLGATKHLPPSFFWHLLPLLFSSYSLCLLCSSDSSSLKNHLHPLIPFCLVIELYNYLHPVSVLWSATSFFTPCNLSSYNWCIILMLSLPLLKESPNHSPLSYITLPPLLKTFLQQPLLPIRKQKLELLATLAWCWETCPLGHLPWLVLIFTCNDRVPRHFIMCNNRGHSIR